MTLNRGTCTLSKKTRLSQITRFDDIYVIEGLLELVSSR